MKQEKGITLIALVITIIVLLILAGVTIALLTNDSSAPAKAAEAAKADAIAATKDDVAMTVNEELLQYYNGTYVAGQTYTGTLSGNLDTKLATVVANHTGKSGLTVSYSTIASSTADPKVGTITISSASGTEATGTITATGALSWN